MTRKIDNGNGRLSKVELTKAADLIAPLLVLDELDLAPARPGIAASAPDAEAGFTRRRLADTFQHSGSGDVKVAFFDADSTLRVSQSGSVSENNAPDVMLLPFVGERIPELTEQGD